MLFIPTVNAYFKTKSVGSDTCLSLISCFYASVLWTRQLCVDLQRSNGYKEAAQFSLAEAKLALKRGVDRIHKVEKGAERFESKAFDSVLNLLENVSSLSPLCPTGESGHQKRTRTKARSTFSPSSTPSSTALYWRNSTPSQRRPRPMPSTSTDTSARSTRICAGSCSTFWRRWWTFLSNLRRMSI